MRRFTPMRSPAWLLLLSLAAFPALAQVSGYSAGPSETRAPGYREIDGGTTPPPAGDAGTAPELDAGAASDGGPTEPAEDDGYQTKVITYKKSPIYAQYREFTTTRMWVLDPGVFNVEQWWNGYEGAPRALGSRYPDDQFFQTEIEMGVAKHVQVDIYANWEINQDVHGNYEIATGGHTGVAAEVRYALGDYWGQIWANPTLYFELTSQYYNAPRAEFRLLLGGTMFTPRLLGALNLAFERNIFYDDQSGIDYEIKADYGVNYELVKDIFRLGIEGVLGFDSHGITAPLPGGIAIGAQDVFPVALIGPSLILTEPRGRIKLLAAFLVGLADYDQPYQPTVILSSMF